MTFVHTEKSRAKQAVRWALKRGGLVRPNRCSKCGEIPAPFRDGRAAIQAHHHDYSKPLDVEWICVKCHREETSLPSGSRNGWAKLNDDLAEMIRNSSIRTGTLAKFLGVHRVTIQRVRNGKRWEIAAAQGGGQ